MERTIAWNNYSAEDRKDLERICSEYIDYLTKAKTEREFVKVTRELALSAGYIDINDVISGKVKVNIGDKIYADYMNKTIAMFKIGENGFDEGMNILGAHIDSPRMDIKQNPLYESEGFAYLDTHYYGGIKKYQWVTLPLAIHGVVCKKDGTTIDVCIGETENDPVFCVTDLLIHLASEQMEKKAAKVVEGENLDILFGSMPLDEDPDTDKKTKDAVKANVLKLLLDTYGMDEEDFISAELEVVPAGKARECGLDRSMILAYGQDDKVCAYTSLKAFLEIAEEANTKRTTCVLLTDKEEIGSVGATGMKSMFFENMVAELIASLDGDFSDIKLRRALSKSNVLSSDVNAAFDPLYASAFEKKNASFFGMGMVFSKFTGSRGKSGSNDANAEYLASIRKIMDDNKVCYHTAELGKVDIGGGGTIAYILSLYGMQVIDCGVAVLSMHAPWEVTSKADVYEAYKGYKAFLKDA